MPYDDLDWDVPDGYEKNFEGTYDGETVQNNSSDQDDVNNQNGSAQDDVNNQNGVSAAPVNPYARFEGVHSYDDIINNLEAARSEAEIETADERSKREKREKRVGFLAKIGDILASMHRSYSHGRGVKPMDLSNMSSKARELFDKQRKDREAERDRWLNYGLKIADMRNADRTFDFNVTKASVAQENAERQNALAYEKLQMQQEYNAQRLENEAKVAEARAEMYRSQGRMDEARAEEAKAAAARSEAAAERERSAAHLNDVRAQQLPLETASRVNANNARARASDASASASRQRAADNHANVQNQIQNRNRRNNNRGSGSQGGGNKNRGYSGRLRNTAGLGL